MDVAEVVERAAEPLIREYRLAFRGPADSIRAIPEVEWTQGDRPGDVPVRQAAHRLFACVACGGGHRLKQGQRFGVPVLSFQRVVPATASHGRRRLWSDDPRIDRDPTRREIGDQSAPAGHPVWEIEQWQAATPREFVQ